MGKIGVEPVRESPDDAVKIKLARDPDVHIVEKYSFVSSILTQPAAFTLTLPGLKGPVEIMRRYPPGPSQGAVALYIGSNRQFTGEIDAVNAEGTADRTSVILRGRDRVARLKDSDVTGDRSFNNVTYQDLFAAALKDVGMAGHAVTISNDANRKIRLGKGVKVYGQPITVSEVQSQASGGGVRNTVVAKMGESWLNFLNRHFAKLGLFVWSDANGEFVLSRPNGEQAPVYHFFRRKGQARSIANVKSFSFTNDTTLRFSEVVTFARGVGRKKGLNHAHGDFEDAEMVALGFQRRRVYRDTNVTSADEAKFYARRKIAEANRASWKLVYVLSGHTAPLIDDLDFRGVVIPDTVARVDDDDLNIHENLYVETVEYRSPPRETVVTMMRPQDLVFGENQAVKGKAHAKQRTRELLSFTRDRNPIDFHRDTNADTNAHRAAISVVDRPPRKPQQ